MSDPIEFTYTSARHALPFLFQGQAQKEFFVNEALARLDALVHPLIQGSAAAPPSTPAEGECWLIDTGASNSWSGHDGAIACFQSGNWLFIDPVDGMRVFDQSAGRFIRYDGAWRSGAAIAVPSGGSTVDEEARNAISDLISALVEAGLVPSS